MIVLNMARGIYLYNAKLTILYLWVKNADVLHDQVTADCMKPTAQTMPHQN